ncbi:MAG: family 43 glycosylhydrolase [Bacteroidales bacterium]|nr:family 43 glycosylhydrolase [Bacteroidales bacterium]
MTLCSQLFTCSSLLTAQKFNTYCNPVNLDYAYERIGSGGPYEAYRSSADPTLVNFKGVYYLFSTNQYGYWWSNDLISWNYIYNPLPPNESGDDMCAPAAWSAGDTLLLINSTWNNVPLYYSTDPKKGFSKKLADPFPQAGWDPALFKDDDGKMYFYWGSGNDPKFNYIKGVEVDPHNGFKNKGPVKELFFIYPDDHGWERFGENNTDTITNPYVEGAWMTKHNGKYYLQYAAPGTEWNVYADGFYVSERPLGPFKYQTGNPFSYKPGGFIRGAGHGSTMQDNYGNYWHVATMQISVKNKFERRIGLFPAGFNDEGQLYCNTAFGDYPQRLVPGPADHLKELFTGWMLLSYKKAAIVSSSDSAHTADLAFDEDIQTYWAAKSGDNGEFLQVDLGGIKTVNALQVNFADHHANLFGKQLNIFQRYQILESSDGINWRILADKSQNAKDVPNDYTELSQSVKTRYLKLVNIHVPGGSFAIGDFRVFGISNGPKPETVRNFNALRGSDKRDIILKWDAIKSAYAYNIYFGIEAGKLYNCMMVMDQDHLSYRGLDRGVTYYFSIQAISETGVSELSAVKKAD